MNRPSLDGDVRLLGDPARGRLQQGPGQQRGAVGRRRVQPAGRRGPRTSRALARAVRRSRRAWSLSSGCRVSGNSHASTARSSSTSTKRPVSGSNADPCDLGTPVSSVRQLAVETGFGFGEPAQFAHQAGGDRFAGHLDEDRSRNTVTGQRQPGSRCRARVAADDRDRRDGASHDLRERLLRRDRRRCGAVIERGRRSRQWRYVVHRAPDATPGRRSAQPDSPRQFTN